MPWDGKKWYQENKERISAKRKIYYQENRDQLLAKRKQYRVDNLDKTKRNGRNSRYKKEYGITLDEFESMKEAQGGVCFLCGKTNGTQELHVDHCHVSGNVRKLLCFDCNSGIGKFGDDPGRLERAATYLREHGL